MMTINQQQLADARREEDHVVGRTEEKESIAWEDEGTTTTNHKPQPQPKKMTINQNS